MLVVGRHYYLKEEGGYRRYVYSKYLWKEKLVRTNVFFDKRMIMEIIKDTRDLFCGILEKDVFLKFFWENANKEMRDALVFSYWLREWGGMKKVGNIEIDYEWFENQLHRFQLSIKKMVNAINPLRVRRTIQGIVRRTGKHKKNLRYKNIHLVVDKVCGKTITGIHWDGHYPVLFTKNMWAHWFGDNIIS